MFENDQNENKMTEELNGKVVPVIEATPEKPKGEDATVKPVIVNSKKTDDDNMLAMIEQTFNNFQPGQIVEGVIVSVTEKEVLVDIGFKSEGAIPIEEFSDTSAIERNTNIKVFINAIEDGEGKLKLSKKKADFFVNLQKLREIKEQDLAVEGVLRKRVKGGMIAEIMGLEAFLPGSQISLKPIPNLDQFIGKEAKFKIINLDEERRNIIVSRKKVLEEELEKKKEYLQHKITLGTELDGIVKNITDYGAFIDLGGIDGLLHITDMSWGRIKHPSEMLNIGDKLKVKVIGYEEENSKISLGLKQLVPHPWENIEAKYPEGTKVSGKVVNITKYGAFIELETGVEGLVHVSELSWTKKVTHPNQVLKVGDNVEAIVLAVSKEEQRISLGVKQVYANPWIDIDEKFPIGTVVNRQIKSLTPFGIFVEIDEGIDGLIHISDISWTKRIYHPREVFRVGDQVESVILSIDKPLHRIALGIKQLHVDPWENIDHKLPPNTEIQGRISKIIPKGLLVDVIISEDLIVEGFVPLSHLAVPKLDKPEYCFNVNEYLNMKVIELDMENRRLILSVRAYYFGRDNEFKDYQETKRNLMNERRAKAKERRAEKRELNQKRQPANASSEEINRESQEADNTEQDNNVTNNEDYGKLEQPNQPDNDHEGDKTQE